MIARCHCGALASACADAGKHVGEDARAANANDRQHAGSYDGGPHRDRAVEDCDCAARNDLFRALGLPPGTCLPCSTRASRGLRANDATSSAARKAA